VIEPASEYALAELIGFGAIAAAGVVSAGLFAGLETGMYTMSNVRLSVRASRGDVDCARLSREYARPKRLLSTLLVANAIAGWFASFGVSQIFTGLGYGPVQAILLDLLVLLPVVFLFGEVLPKDLFRVHADRWMPRYSTVLVGLRMLLCATGIVPIVAGIGTLASRLFGGSRAGSELLEARARVSALLAEGAGSGGLSEAQLGFADRVFTMRGITTGQEMRVWRDVASLSISASPAERARVLLESGASRLPVVDATGRVSGLIVAVDHFAAPDASTSSLVRPIVMLSPTVTALDAIQTMRRERAQLALVADRPDRPLGIVSMKDLVEPLVGDLAAW
jgi:putative hemolysin